MKILHLIDHYKIGGPGKTIINSAKFIDTNCFSIHVSSFLQSDSQLTEFAQKVLSAGIPYLPLGDSRGLGLNTMRRLINYINKNNINILHTHGYKTDLIGLMIKICCPNLFLVTTHHGWIVNNRRQAFYKALDLFLTRFFDGVITVSKELYAELPKYGAKGPLRAVIHNAIVIEDYKNNNQRLALRRRYSFLDENCVIGVFGRLSAEKGCHDMLEAFQLAFRRNPNLRLIFVGDGPLLEEIIYKINELKLDQAVTVAGHQNPIQPYYEAIDILVCPSHTEGISNVLLEAMAFGLPVVATRVGGNPEIVEHNLSGLLVPSRNPLAMAEALTQVASNANTRTSLGQNGIARAIERFDFQKRMRHVEQFYKKMFMN